MKDPGVVDRCVDLSHVLLLTGVRARGKVDPPSRQRTCAHMLDASMAVFHSAK